MTSRRAPWVQFEHKGCLWEGIEGNNLWSWHPYMESGDFESISVFAYADRVTLRFRGHEHECESREDAFDLALELVVKAELLDVFNERIRWRIGELERRYGHRLSGEQPYSNDDH